MQGFLVLAIIRHLSRLCRSAFRRGADQPPLSSGSVLIPNARVFSDNQAELAVGCPLDESGTHNAPQLRPCAAGMSTNDLIQCHRRTDRLMHQGIVLGSYPGLSEVMTLNAVAGVQMFLAYRCSRATVQ